jgi:hypothetical protein
MGLHFKKHLNANQRTATLVSVSKPKPTIAGSLTRENAPLSKKRKNRLEMDDFKAVFVL